MRVKISRKTDALLVIDALPTFMPGGGLSVEDGHLIIPVIVHISALFRPEMRIKIRELHDLGSISLASSYIGFSGVTFLQKAMPDYLAPHALFTDEELDKYLKKTGGQMLWPDHAIRGTKEAEWHKDLQKIRFGFELIKGTDPKCDSYSVFYDNLRRSTGLSDELRRRGVKRVFLCGLAFDYCVGWSAEDAHNLGFEVFVINDATRPVGHPADSVDKMKKSFKDRGIRLIQSSNLTLW